MKLVVSSERYVQVRCVVCECLDMLLGFVRMCVCVN